MKTGRPAANTARKALGTDSDEGYLVPPSEVSTTVRAIWWRIVRDYSPDHFREAHRDLLLEYCRTVMRLKEVRAKLAAEGLVTENSRGTLVAHPLVSVEGKFALLLLRQARVLRITPQADRDEAPTVSETPRKERRGAAKRKANAKEKGVDLMH